MTVEYTPTTALVREWLGQWRPVVGPEGELGASQRELFDRWLASPSTRAEVLGDRDKLREKIARALCQREHADRSFDEYVSPSAQLWHRFLPEADAVLSVLYQEGAD